MKRPVVTIAGSVLIAMTITACAGTSGKVSAGSQSRDNSSATTTMLTPSASDTSSDTSSPAAVSTPAPTRTAPPPLPPFNVGGYLAGNAKPTYLAGAPGKVDIVSEGALEKTGIGAVLPVAYRNNTGAAISHVDLTATARLNGKLVASGSSQQETPAQVQPGEIGFAIIYFEDEKSLPDNGTGLKYEFTADTMPADTSFFNTAPLKVSEATYNGSSIVGTAVNKTGKSLSGPYAVDIYCFSDNKLMDQTTAYADQKDDLAAGGKVSFTANLYDKKCGTFTLGVSGYFN